METGVNTRSRDVRRLQYRLFGTPVARDSKLQNLAQVQGHILAGNPIDTFVAMLEAVAVATSGMLHPAVLLRLVFCCRNDVSAVQLCLAFVLLLFRCSKVWKTLMSRVTSMQLLLLLLTYSVILKQQCFAPTSEYYSNHQATHYLVLINNRVSSDASEGVFNKLARFSCFATDVKNIHIQNNNYLFGLLKKNYKIMIITLKNVGKILYLTSTQLAVVTNRHFYTSFSFL